MLTRKSFIWFNVEGREEETIISIKRQSVIAFLYTTGLLNKKSRIYEMLIRKSFIWVNIEEEKKK